MKERPILFKGEMVRAILAGTKSQTRRLVKLKHPEAADTFAHAGGLQWETGECHHGSTAYAESIKCPYGERGDLLWVRETFAAGAGEVPHTAIVAYRASCTDDAFDYVGRDGSVCSLKVKRWTPSIFMPRACSRITLEITDVRVERLQAISEADAKAEGVTPFPRDPEGDCWTDGKHRTAYQYLWNEINGWCPNAWDANPWVWCVSFQRLEAAQARRSA